MEKKQVNKRVILIAVIAVIVAAVGIVIFLMNQNKDAYRSIQVYELEGTATITRADVGIIDAAENLFLQSGDEIEVAADSSMRLKLDEDKYVMVEESSKFSIIATGTSEESKTTINLTQGAITNEIQNKLNANSSYEVSTPNSVMAVRGTVFRVEVEVDEEGNSYVRVSTFDGKVSSRLIKPDGTIVEDEVMIDAGKEVGIQGTDSDSAYITDPEDIDYSTLPVKTLEFLLEVAENGTDIGITKDDLTKLIDEKKAAEEEPDFYNITFSYQGQTFGTQEVVPGGTVTKPKLAPAETGAWDYDFSTQVHEDTVIEWK